MAKKIDRSQWRLIYSQSISQCGNYVFEEYSKINSGGKWSIRTHYDTRECCELRQCDCCGIFGPRKKINYCGLFKDPAAYWESWKKMPVKGVSDDRYDFLCKSCLMTVRNQKSQYGIALDMLAQVKDAKKQIRKVQRETISNDQ